MNHPYFDFILIVIMLLITLYLVIMLFVSYPCLFAILILLYTTYVYNQYYK